MSIYMKILKCKVVYGFYKGLYTKRIFFLQKLKVLGYKYEFFEEGLYECMTGKSYFDSHKNITKIRTSIKLSEIIY